MDEEIRKQIVDHVMVLKDNNPEQIIPYIRSKQKQYPELKTDPLLLTFISLSESMPPPSRMIDVRDTKEELKSSLKKFNEELIRENESEENYEKKLTSHSYRKKQGYNEKFTPFFREYFRITYCTKYSNSLEYFFKLILLYQDIVNIPLTPDIKIYKQDFTKIKDFVQKIKSNINFTTERELNQFINLIKNLIDGIYEMCGPNVQYKISYRMNFNFSLRKFNEHLHILSEILSSNNQTVASGGRKKSRKSRKGRFLHKKSKKSKKYRKKKSRNKRR